MVIQTLSRQQSTSTQKRVILSFMGKSDGVDVRFLNLIGKAILLTVQRFLDWWAVVWLTQHEAYGSRWWTMVTMLLFASMLQAATLTKHKCALKSSRPYGWHLAGIATLLHISPLVEMVDKLGDHVCWNIDDDRFDHAAGASFADQRGRRYSENLMRGLRKLSIASVFASLPSTVCHLRNLLELVTFQFNESQQRPGLPGFWETSAAVIFGLVSISIAWGDLVLYIWVDDSFVRSHKVLVVVHYMIEIMARLPTATAFLVVATGTEKGMHPLTMLMTFDVGATIVLLLVPTFVATTRRRLSCAHLVSQLMTAGCMSTLLIICNIAFFDQRESFRVLNVGYYLVKYAEVFVMLSMARKWWLEDIMHGVEGAQAIFAIVCEVVFFIHVLNLLMVWVVVPYMRRKMEEQMFGNQHLHQGSARGSFGIRPRLASQGRVLGFPTSTFATRYLDDVQALELESVAAHQVAEGRLRSCSGAGLRCVDDSTFSVVACLGDILDALCLLSQTQSLKNSAIVSRACIAQVLWSLLLPWEGIYDDGDGGRVRLVVLDSARGTLLVQKFKPESEEFEIPDPGNGKQEDLANCVMQEFVAVVIQGTVLEVVSEEDGHILGTYDGRSISFSGGRHLTWTKIIKSTPKDASCKMPPLPPLVGGVDRSAILRLVLPQLVLAIRWEPTILGLGAKSNVRTAGIAAIDASQRPLLCFVIRYAFAARDAELLSEVYWSLWCLSQDRKDSSSRVYDKARWVLVFALRGEIEFWEGARAIRLTSRHEEDIDFRRQTLHLLRKQSVVWRKCALLAHMAREADGDSGEKTRAIQRQMYGWTGESNDVDQQAEDPYLDDVSEADGAASSGFFEDLTMPIDPGVVFQGVEVSECSVLQSNACPLLLTCKIDAREQCARPAGPPVAFPSESSLSPAPGGAIRGAQEATSPCGFDQAGDNRGVGTSSPSGAAANDIEADQRPGQMQECQKRVSISQAEPDTFAFVSFASVAVEMERMGTCPSIPARREMERQESEHMGAAVSSSSSQRPRHSKLAAAAVAAAVVRKDFTRASASTASTPLLAVPTAATGAPVAKEDVGDEDKPRKKATLRKYLVKVGDDLRQDQLVLQMFSLMDLVWRERLPAEEHEMLQLVPYRVQAITPDAGFIKMVPKSISMSKALQLGDLTSWLDARRPASVSLEDVINNLCGSVAAYCVATYVLGIGDRHLDNLQITPTGHFFHIDFGFIFGSDPKPFAPQLRLPSPIATALLSMPAPGTRAGRNDAASRSALGKENENMLDRCLLLAGRAYIALRRAMPLWMPLLRVIGEAGGAGCQISRNDAAMVFVRDRLRSDLGDDEEEAAVADFLLVLCENVEALYPMLTDKVHQLGLFWK